MKITRIFFVYLFAGCINMSKIPNCLLKLIHHSWSEQIQISIQRITNISLNYDFTPFQLILIWVDRYEQIGQYVLMLIENKILIFVIMETTEILNQEHGSGMHLLQDLIIWKQNQVYVLAPQYLQSHHSNMSAMKDKMDLLAKEILQLIFNKMSNFGSIIEITDKNKSTDAFITMLEEKAR
uniref:Uncharacterized protein n=1 Tax=Strigamia maritima TaxID=126957 RepID=T1J2D9_STRMM